ncbi:hypothetical protein KFF05_09650 [bacterium SCSIO 12827]|nr:hypothetical protein KFF05_09650 [bacterium SCSIO 12827]
MSGKTRWIDDLLQQHGPRKSGMQYDPKEIAKNLIQEHGLDGALSVAIEGAIDAQRAGDNYTLSVWREIKAVIRKQITDQAA